ncbi:MAG: efflux transporter outer membrane subunit [Veillonella sp.]|nr:efflux transporter outer membrane subunit [Veillonella sp.]
MMTNRKQLLIVYICLALGAWSASAGVSFSQSNGDANRTSRDNTTVQHRSEKTVDDSDQGSSVIASYYKDGKKKKKKSTAAEEPKLSEKQKATKELNEHSWVEEAGKHPLPYEVVEGKAVSELDQLIDLTLKNNRQLEVARSRVRQGRLQLGIAEAQRLPWLDASGSWSVNRGQGEWDSDREAIKNLPIPDKMTRNVETGKLGIDARWEIDIFGRQKAKSRAASNSLQASQADLYSTWVSLSAETALQYMSLRTLQEQLRITEEDVKRQQEALELIKINYQSGIINELPVQQATYALSQTQAEIPSLKKNIASTMSALSILTGTVPGEVDGLLMENTSLPAVDPHMFIGIPAEALRQRPDIQAAERRIAAQQQKTKAAKADLKPRFSLNGSIGLESFSSGGLISAIGKMIGIGPSITMPIFNAGAIRKNIKVQTEKEQEYLALYEETVLKAVGEVRNAVTDASQDHIKSEELKSAVESAQQAESLAQTNFDSGLSDYLSVLDARRNVLSARRQYIMSRGQEFADTVRLFKSLGGHGHGSGGRGGLAC